MDAREILLGGYEEVDRGHETPCWEWTGDRSHRGDYGRVTINGRTWSTHRLSYVTFKGPIPDKHVIRHMCHNRICYNPDHLEPGTQRQNNLDARDSGRAVYGQPPIDPVLVAYAMYLKDMGEEDWDIAQELTRIRGTNTSDGNIRDWFKGRKRKDIYNWWQERKEEAAAHDATPTSPVPSSEGDSTRHRDDWGESRYRPSRRYRSL